MQTSSVRSESSIVSREPAVTAAYAWVLRIPAANRLGIDRPRLQPWEGPARGDLNKDAPISTPPPAFAGDARFGAILEGALHEDPARDSQLGLDPTCSDLDRVLAAYRRGGANFLYRMRGVFSIVLWDAARRLVLCARDPMGIHALFFAEIPSGGLLVSSALDVLARHAEVPATINRATLANPLCGNSTRQEETCYQSIRRVPPGHVLKQVGGHRSLERYWDPCPPGTEIRWVREDELDQFDTLLDRAVAQCLSPRPTAISLSGGLDSVSVAAVAAAQGRLRPGPPPLALSLAFPHPDCNEEPIQRAMADRLGLPMYMAPFFAATGPRGLLAEAFAISRYWPFPLDNIWYPAYRHLHAEAARRGVGTILTGSGGDEWLTVTPKYIADLLVKLDVRGLLEYIRVVDSSFRLPRRTMLRSLLWTCGLRPILAGAVCQSLSHWAPALLSNWRRWRFRRFMPAWLAPDPGLRAELIARKLDAPLPAGPDQSYYIRDGRRALDHPLMSLEMDEYFEQGRQFGLDLRHPYWDTDLVEFLYRVPPRAINRGGRSKGLIRDKVERDFPNLGFLQQKKVTTIDFFGSTVLTEATTLLPAFGELNALGDLGIVDSRSARTSMQSIVDRGEKRQAYRIWSLLNLETWLREHL